MKTIRQGMRISMNELIILYLELKKEQEDLNKELKIKNIIDFGKKFQINIINKTPECSDTWEIEK